MKHVLTVSLLSFCSILCVPVAAKDPATFSFAEKATQSAERTEHLFPRFADMHWHEATEIYRTASGELKSDICHYAIGEFKRRFHGMTRRLVIATLGKPDGTDEGEHGKELIYTGEGYVSDSMSGYIFKFDADGKVKHVVSAN